MGKMHNIMKDRHMFKVFPFVSHELEKDDTTLCFEVISLHELFYK